MRKPNLIVAGGGTGGHVLAGVAVADAWARIHGGEVTFVGARGGIEEKLIPRAGYSLFLLRLGALKGVSGIRRLRTLVLIPWALVRSAWILIRKRPRAVVGVGGYAAGPMVLTARLLGWLFGTRVSILEQNAVPGFTNRILGRFAHRVFSAFPVGEGRFPGRKVEVTGNPVRKEMRPLPPALLEPFTVFVFGGSQGALGVNSLVIEALPWLESYKGRLRFIHQTGEKDFDRVKAEYVRCGWPARVEKFIYQMPEAYAQASVVVCRAGSSTLAEIAAVGRASILVPFPYASDNHQELNARIFEKGGASRVLIQKSAKAQDLVKALRELIENPPILRGMEKAAKGFYRPDAAERVVKGTFQG